ncbi:toprim domain-containing protein [Adlercreutzia sp. ZJ138]|uniref:toprim domain-containing protein n=1 Tax=Adlercreutzia sp. ZJ138 TaxID=2709405 RepID=UPI0013EDB485|nr:toprim domain-containing protein [Adlercreutzia sp. ZJ138]
MVTETDREALRGLMPELLSARCGITDLRRSFRCPSPAHEDRDPSAHYYAKDNTVHCFGCGKTWDVFSLVAELDGVDGFAEQARAVADAVGYRLGDGGERGGARMPRSKRKPKPRPPFDPPREAGGANCAEACGNAFAHLYSAEGDIGRRYLRWRGLDDGDAAAFGLGFTRDPREVMPEFSVYEPRALGFITIPFWNRDFSIANYCMVRTVCRPGDARNKEWRPRGLASPLWREWLLSVGAEQVYVTEGLIDAMALAKITGGDTVALGGVANAKRLAQVLYATPPERRPARVTVAMDEDDEGRRTRDRICRDLDVLGVPHAVMPPYPGGAKDADEYLMAMRGREWEFEVREPSIQTGYDLYYTRWL